MPLTAEKYDQPPIPMVDAETGKKIRLSLRKMSFAREIADLPSDLLQLHEMFIQQRAIRNENIYVSVATWNKLCVYDRFWTSFRFHSEEEYLAYYGLPDGTTLAGWTVMVNLFDKATFALLGDQVLSFMIRAVGQYQDDVDQRKKDYQAIFDRYCDHNVSFDKQAFFAVVRRYVTESYEVPAAKEAGLTTEQWQRQRTAVSVTQPGKTAERTVRVIHAQQHFGPKLTHDFDWKEKSCPSCVSKVTIIKAFQKHLRHCEDIIRKKIGEKAVPARPDEIKDL